MSTYLKMNYLEKLLISTKNLSCEKHSHLNKQGREIIGEEDEVERRLSVRILHNCRECELSLRKPEFQGELADPRLNPATDMF